LRLRRVADPGLEGCRTPSECMAQMGRIQRPLLHGSESGAAKLALMRPAPPVWFSPGGIKMVGQAPPYGLRPEAGGWRTLCKCCLVGRLCWSVPVRVPRLASNLIRDHLLQRLALADELKCPVATQKHLGHLGE